MKRFLLCGAFALALAPFNLSGADLVRGVRYKLSAGDLASGVAAAEDYRLSTGVDAEYWNAVGWLARGAMMLGRPDMAAKWVEELRSGIPQETDELIVPLANPRQLAPDEIGALGSLHRRAARTRDLLRRSGHGEGEVHLPIRKFVDAAVGRRRAWIRFGSLR